MLLHKPIFTSRHLIIAEHMSLRFVVAIRTNHKTKVTFEKRSIFKSKTSYIEGLSVYSTFCLFQPICSVKIKELTVLILHFATYQLKNSKAILHLHCGRWHCGRWFL